MRALLSAVAFALAIVLLWQWGRWPPPPLRPNAVGSVSDRLDESSRPAATRLDQLSPLGEKEEYEIVKERPLFLPERRPPTDEPEDEIAAEPTPLSDLTRMDLNAVLITPSQSLAWILDSATKELLRLRLGDELAEWSVQQILPDRVLLERQGEQDTLILRDYKNMPPSAPQRRRSAAPKAPRPDRGQPARGRQDTPQGSAAHRPQARPNSEQSRQ